MARDKKNIEVSLIQLIPLLVVVPFWMWMFRDMSHNPRLTAQERNSWALRFVSLNVLAAIWYYATEYRSRH